MPKTKLLLAGVCSTALFAGGAIAGELKGVITDVNAGNVSEMDNNSPNGPFAVLNTENPDEVTIDEGPVVISPQRVFGADAKDMWAHVEIDIFDDIPTFSGDQPYLIEIVLDGAEWKKELSPAELVRPGTDLDPNGDAIYSESAEGVNEDRTFVGDNDIEFFLTAAEISESSIGFNLPIAIPECADVTATFTVKTFVGNVESTRGPIVVPIASCAPQDSIDAIASTPFDILVEVGDRDTFFEKFIRPAGLEDKGAELVTTQEIGMVTMTIQNDLFDPKTKSNNVNNRRARLFDYTDIDEYFLTYEFESLQGIDEVTLDECGINATLVGTTASWVLDQSQVANCFPGIAANPTVGGVQVGTTGISVTSLMDGAILDQSVDLVEHRVTLDDPASSSDADRNMWVDGVDFGNEEDAWRIVRNGLNFGPFDWTTGPDKAVQSVFRFTGLQEGDPEYLRGYAIAENSQNGNTDGICPIDFASYVANGEAVINPTKLAELFSNPECVEPNGGPEGPLNADVMRADVTFTFFCPIDVCQKTDADRLLFNSSTGTLADYGDNGNDSNSVKARSCDPGRFGAHTHNSPLLADISDALVELCYNGELPDFLDN
ncbi:MAG: hypothetical protein AAFY84_12615 [Pseudomonadota bacterium]